MPKRALSEDSLLDSKRSRTEADVGEEDGSAPRVDQQQSPENTSAAVEHDNSSVAPSNASDAANGHDGQPSKVSVLATFSMNPTDALSRPGTTASVVTSFTSSPHTSSLRPVAAQSARLPISVSDSLLAYEQSTFVMGQYTYRPCSCLLPPLTLCIGQLVKVYVPAQHISYSNRYVRRHALWGTDIYTDDSDIVAMLIHSRRIDMHSPTEMSIPKGPEMQQQHPYGRHYPDNVVVTLRILPRLEFYPSTTSNFVRSRAWTHHDGQSLRIVSVEATARTTAPLTRQRWKEEARLYSIALAALRRAEDATPALTPPNQVPESVTLAFCSTREEPLVDGICVRYDPRLLQDADPLDPSTWTAAKLRKCSLHFEGLDDQAEDVLLGVQRPPTFPPFVRTVTIDWRPSGAYELVTRVQCTSRAQQDETPQSIDRTTTKTVEWSQLRFVDEGVEIEDALLKVQYMYWVARRA
ncbi:hypothetical protein RI367_005636 [Sorochytrium milnesiophthora]